MNQFSFGKRKARTIDEAQAYRQCLDLLQKGQIRQAVEALWPLCAEPFARFASTYHIPDGTVEEAIQDFFVKILGREAQEWERCQNLKSHLWVSFRNFMNDRYTFYKIRRMTEIAVPHVVQEDEGLALESFPAQSSDDEHLEPYCEECVWQGWAAFKAEYAREGDAITRRVKEGWSYEQLRAYMLKTYGRGGTRDYVSRALRKCRTYIHNHLEQFCDECLDQT